MTRHVQFSLDDDAHRRLRMRSAELDMSIAEYARTAVLTVLGNDPPGGAGEGVQSDEGVRPSAASDRPAGRAAPSRPDRPAHTHKAVSNGPVPKCACGAVRVDGEWRRP